MIEAVKEHDPSASPAQDRAEQLPVTLLHRYKAAFKCWGARGWGWGGKDGWGSSNSRGFSLALLTPSLSPFGLCILITVLLEMKTYRLNCIMQLGELAVARPGAWESVK